MWEESKQVSPSSHAQCWITHDDEHVDNTRRPKTEHLFTFSEREMFGLFSRSYDQYSLRRWKKIFVLRTEEMYLKSPSSIRTFPERRGSEFFFWLFTRFPVENFLWEDFFRLSLMFEFTSWALHFQNFLMENSFSEEHAVQEIRTILMKEWY